MEDRKMIKKGSRIQGFKDSSERNQSWKRTGFRIKPVLDLIGDPE
jgi:hypothetical protein